MVSIKKLAITGLAVGLLSFPLVQQEVSFAKEQPKTAQVSKQTNNLSTKQVLELAKEFNKRSTYIQRGGDYKKGEYKTFQLNTKTYRYLSSSIDTKKELKEYLEKVLVPAEAENFIKSRGIIEYKGKLAQVEADGGSLLQWEIATAKFIKTNKNTTTYSLTVPVWNTKEKQNFLVEYQYVNKSGWKISKEPQLEKNTAITDKLAIDLAAKYAKAILYVQAGGEYRPGEYKTFNYKGSTYRYLSSKIDTKTELLTYLTQSMTKSEAEQFIKARGIIEYSGRLAQLDADGGSLAEWTKATAQFLKKEQKTSFYRITVPLGDTKQNIMYIVEYQYVENEGWRVSKAPYTDLDIPGNINPVYILFNYLLVDTKVAQNQFLPYSSFSVTEFKKGVKKVELINMKEIGRTNSHVEYIVNIKANLDANYNGPLNEGENKLYFTVQQTGYMEFKIDQIGIINMY